MIIFRIIKEHNQIGFAFRNFSSSLEYKLYSEYWINLLESKSIKCKFSGWREFLIYDFEDFDNCTVSDLQQDDAANHPSTRSVWL